MWTGTKINGGKIYFEITATCNIKSAVSEHYSIIFVVSIGCNDANKCVVVMTLLL